jgi:acyl-CoA synthetase (AMP-forming)/AMP-acid ligase II
MLDLAIERYGSLAFVTDVRTGNTYTYLDLLRNAKRISAQIASHGITPGSRIAFLTKNDTVFFPLLFACARCGVTLIPLNRELPTRDLESLLEHAQVSFVFIDKTGEYFNLQGITIEWNRNNNNYEYENTFVNEEAMVIYTSGTSGFAKGVILTHQNLINMAHVFVDFYNLAPAQRFISMLPYYHINAPMITGLVCVASGAHVYVTELFGRTHIDSVLSLIETYKINILSATPSIIAMLLRQARDRLPKACRSLDFCFCGTAALPESTWRDFENTVGVPIYQGYGLTETTTWATMTPRNGPRRYNTVGIPVASKIKIEGSPPGEVLVKGPIVMKGYLNDPGLTEKSFSDEWYRTGDLGYIDSDGHLILSGRAKNIIKRRGVLVYPNAVDEVIRRSGFVEDTCTFGIPDELAGEKIVSACVLRHGTLNDVRKHLTENLARQTRPDELHEVGVIAQNEMGKPAVDAI